MIIRGMIGYGSVAEYLFWRPLHLARRFLCRFGWHDWVYEDDAVCVWCAK